VPYSVDLREKIIDAIKSGMSQVNAAKIFNVARRTIYNWLCIQEKTGSLEPQTNFQKGHSHAITDLEKFKKFVNAHADYTQDEIAEHYSVGHATIGRMLKKIGYTRKKRITPTQNKTKKKGVNFKKK